MEKKMETTTMVYIWIIERKMEIAGLYRGLGLIDAPYIRIP